MYLHVLINGSEKCCAGDKEILSLSASIVIRNDGPMGMMVTGGVDNLNEEEKGRIWLDEEVLIGDVIEFSLLDNVKCSTPSINLSNKTHVIIYEYIYVDVLKNDDVIFSDQATSYDQFQISIEYFQNTGKVLANIEGFYDKPGSELEKINIINTEFSLSDKLKIIIDGKELLYK